MADPNRLRVMLVDDDPGQLRALEAAVHAEGHIVVARMDTHGNLVFAAEQHRPDVACIGVEVATREVLDGVAELSRKKPMPVLLFAARSDAGTTRRALEAGVTAYIVDGFQPGRLNDLLEVAIARFDLYHHMRTELDQARSRLADTRDIEKAKGLLMKRQNLDEATAYGMLRRHAMERKMKIGDIARELLKASEMLGSFSETSPGNGA
jgi:response regulator NasT